MLLPSVDHTKLQPKHPHKAKLREIYRLLRLAKIGVPPKNKELIDKAMDLVSELEHKLR